MNKNIKKDKLVQKLKKLDFGHPIEVNKEEWWSLQHDSKEGKIHQAIKVGDKDPRIVYIVVSDTSLFEL